MSCLYGEAARVVPGLLDLFISRKSCVAKALHAATSAEQVKKRGENEGEEDQAEETEHEVDHVILAIILAARDG